MEVVASEEVDEFTEGEAAEVVGLDNAVELGVLVFEPHDAGTCEDYFEVRIEVVTPAELTGPERLLEDLVDEEHTAASTVETAGEVGYAEALKVEVVHVDIQTLLVEYIEMVFGILQEESGFADSTSALDANHAVIPVDLVHQSATDRCVDVLNEVSVGPEKSFHLLWLV